MKAMKLHEGMIKAKQASKEGLALMVEEDPYQTSVVLYDHIGVYNDLVDYVNRHFWKQETEDYHPEIKSYDLWDFLGEARYRLNLERHVRGMIIFSRDRGCPSQIKTSAARNRYGPLMYEIAMALSPHGIVPDTTVSADAKRVWTKFYRRNDIIKVPVEKAECMDTWSIALKLKKRLSYEALTQRHKDFVKYLLGLGKLLGVQHINATDASRFPDQLGQDLFKQLY